MSSPNNAAPPEIVQVLVEVRDGVLWVDGTLVAEVRGMSSFPLFLVGMEVAAAITRKSPHTLTQERRRGKRSTDQ